MKTNPCDKLKTIFELEHDLKIKGKNSIDKTTPLRTSKGWVWIQKDNISKQVSQKKLNQYLQDEWKIIKKS